VSERRDVESARLLFDAKVRRRHFIDRPCNDHPQESGLGEARIARRTASPQLVAAQRLDDRLGVTRGHGVHIHVHQGRGQRFLAAMITLELLRREAPL
jgi:hypothetical protein